MKNCPFCSNDKLGIVKEWSEFYDVYRYYVLCYVCEARGPKFHDRDLAETAWEMHKCSTQ